MDSFYGLIVQNYALMLAAIISIVKRQLTRFHAMFVLVVVGSPLTIYLLAHAIRSIFFKCNARLESIFGKSVGFARFLNRFVVVAAVPLWVYMIVAIVQPRQAVWFTQTACDDAILQTPGDPTSIHGSHDGSFALFVGIGVAYFAFITVPLGSFIFVWFIIAWVRKRKEIRQRPKGVNYFRRVWRVVTEHYPVIRFAITIMLPFLNWILLLEGTAKFSNESFTPTLGQVSYAPAV